MISTRCKMLVQEELKKLNLRHTILDFGIVEILEDITKEQREQLKVTLLQSGWNLLDDKRSMLIEKIKNMIVEMISQGDDLPKIKYSDYLSKKLGQDYTYLSNIFAEIQGITIQQFIILQKVDKIKELLLYSELNLTQISYKLHYSSVAHLSNQFKSITGLSPSFYKQIKKKRQENLKTL